MAGWELCVVMVALRGQAITPDVGHLGVLLQCFLRLLPVPHPREGDDGLWHALGVWRDVGHGLEPAGLADGIEVGVVGGCLDVHAADCAPTAAALGGERAGERGWAGDGQCRAPISNGEPAASARNCAGP